MVQIVATLGSLLIGMAALGVIALTVTEEWDAFVKALGFRAQSSAPSLPPQTRMVKSPRRARMIRLPAEPAARRAA
jgi:hypothetical protein